MMIVPAGVKVHLALGYTDMRKGIDGLAMLVQETLKKDPFSRPSVRLPRQTSADRQDPVLGRQRAVPVHQAARSGRVHVAAADGVRRLRHAVSGAARDADRGHRLARARTQMAARSSRLRSCRNLHRI